MIDGRRLQLIRVVWAWADCCLIVKKWWAPMRPIPIDTPAGTDPHA